MPTVVPPSLVLMHGPETRPRHCSDACRVGASAMHASSVSTSDWLGTRASGWIKSAASRRSMTNLKTEQPAQFTAQAVSIQGFKRSLYRLALNSSRPISMRRISLVPAPIS
jgi:hypothetical protein